MNIILFVTALVMALALMTYGKWEAYRNLHVVESQFKNYMEKTERSAINQAAEKWYKTTTVSKGKGGGGGKTTQANSRLSFHLFVDAQAQQKASKEFAQTQYLAKKLIYVLYAQAPFYKQLLHDDPQFVDQFLASLMVADSLPKEKKLKYAKDLNALKLPNPILDDFLYKILKGAPDPNQEKPPEPNQHLLPPPPPQMEEDDEDPDPDIAQEFHSPVGYHSVLDSITLQPSKKVRVFLASRYLLTAIFNDKSTVDEVLRERQRLYQAVVAGAIQAKDASKQFESSFAQRADTNVNGILDFTVSKTNPKNYE